MVFSHGGDIEGYRLKYGRSPIDFSANCNPLGLPKGVRQAICDAANHADAYPDPRCRRLCSAIAQNAGVPPQQVLCGNGAADLIYRLALAVKPRRAVVTAPIFSEYELALQTVGCQVTRHPLTPKDGFSLTAAILTRLKPDLDLFILCNPNNPTGLTAEPALLRCVLELCAQNKILLAVDECFNGFLAEPEKHTLRHDIPAYPNLLILDAFTKIYAMAGVRLGYCLSGNAALLADMQSAGPPWAVSSLAQAAGIAALREHDYLPAARALIRAEKAFLLSGLQALGIKVLGSEANYIFFYTGRPHLAERLRERGILIRDCSNYAGLSAGYCRIAVRPHNDNAQLLDALSKLVCGPDRPRRCQTDD